LNIGDLVFRYDTSYSVKIVNDTLVSGHVGNGFVNTEKIPYKIITKNLTLPAISKYENKFLTDETNDTIVRNTQTNELYFVQEKLLKHIPECTCSGLCPICGGQR
jgi:hypothetical protein